LALFAKSLLKFFLFSLCPGRTEVVELINNRIEKFGYGRAKVVQ
jgi:hypothetical protein